MLGFNSTTVMMLHLLALVVVVALAAPKDEIDNEMTHDAETNPKTTLVTVAMAMLIMAMSLAMTFWCGFH